MRTRTALAAVLTMSIVLAFSPSLLAKGETTRLTIRGGDLISPIVVTEPGILHQFNVWSGAGTFHGLGGIGDDVYLPGAGDEMYAVNSRSIFRGHGFEGHWLRARPEWQQAVARLLGADK